MQRKQQLMNTISEGATGVGDIFLQRGGLKSPAKTSTSDLNDFITKEKIKSEMDLQDSYKQSQTALNRAILKSINEGQGGDLVYRDQMTGEEVPSNQALQDISQGKQYIINRRITSRQGVKEEPISKPKELTEGEVKTSTGAEEVLSEIDELKNIIQGEPAESGASVPFLGSSAQAQGVKIPFVAPYGISEKGQEYRTVRESINNRLLYLRSGAQINDKEYQRLSGMLPMLFRSDKVDLQQLDRFKSEFEKILQRIQSGRRGISTPTQAKPQDQFSVGQTMVKDGITYTYQGNGQWEY
jgi:hypothetical protein